MDDKRSSKTFLKCESDLASYDNPTCLIIKDEELMVNNLGQTVKKFHESSEPTEIIWELKKRFQTIYDH